MPYPWTYSWGMRRFPVMIVLGLCVVGCSSDPTSATAGSSAATTAVAGSSASSGVPASGDELTASEFAAALKLPKTTVLDVRTPAEFATGHLPGAVNLDVGSPSFTTEVGKLVRGTHYAVYCRSGNRSAQALQIMQDAGITSTYHLGGGITAWQQAGGQVVKG